MSTEAERAAARYQEKMRNRGTPMMVLPHEFEAARSILLKARTRAGMDDDMIARQIGLHPGGIYKTRVGISASMRRDTYNKIMTLRPEVIEGRTHPSRGKIPDGAMRDPTGTQRMVRALRADGFSNKVMASILGVTPEAVSDLARTPRKGVYQTTWQEVSKVYAKLAGADPEDHGMTAPYVSAQRAWARKHGWAPSRCWDDDTIDDPKAVPEWTGACGTEEGYRVHIRETLAGHDLLPCPACKKVIEVRLTGRHGAAGERPFHFDHGRFDQALKDRGINPRQLAIKMGRSVSEADRFYRWRQGSRSPQNRSEVIMVAEALDLHPSTLMQDLSEDEVEANSIKTGRFNPYVFKAVIDMACISQSEAGAICGVSHASVSKWIRGEFSPRDKRVIIPLAEKLGLNLEVFYK